ncbi:unnamed protein product, partial [Choristocarpus tenellus]
PKTVRAARSSPECDLWDRARVEEMSDLLLNNVWVEAVLPPGRRAIDTKWIHKRKTNKFGEVVRYKAHLVAKGFRKIEGLDFQDTFAPTPSPASLKMVLALAAGKDWELKHWDVKQAFIQAGISEEIFIRLCVGCGICSGKIVCLVKALYGTKQASREFNNLLVHILEQCGFENAELISVCYAM